VIDGNKQFITLGLDRRRGADHRHERSGARQAWHHLLPDRSAGARLERGCGVERKLAQRSSIYARSASTACACRRRTCWARSATGYRIALKYLSRGRIAVAAQSIGMARAAYGSRARLRQGTRPPSASRSCSTRRSPSTWPTWRRRSKWRASSPGRARLEAAGERSLREASMAKLFASEMAEKVCSTAIQIHGGYGYVEDYPVGKIWRDVRVTQIYEGTSEVQRIVISRDLAGQ